MEQHMTLMKSSGMVPLIRIDKAQTLVRIDDEMGHMLVYKKREQQTRRRGDDEEDGGVCCQWHWEFIRIG